MPAWRIEPQAETDARNSCSSRLPPLELLLEDEPRQEQACRFRGRRSGHRPALFRSRLNLLPIRERLLGALHLAQRHGPSPEPMCCVICIVSRFLQIHECLCHAGNLRRNHEARIETRNHRRHLAAGSERLARRSHLLMHERTRKEQPQSLVGASCKRTGCLAHEQMEESIICRGDCAAKTHLEGPLLLAQR
jgi:hypothetical protein